MTMAPGRREVLGGLAAAFVGGGTARAAGAPLTLLTNWYAQAEHGGFYQAQASGLYAKAGLNVNLRMGGPQVNAMQLLLAGQCDLALLQPEEAIRAGVRGLPAVAVATTFQKGLAGIMTHPDIHDPGQLRGHPIFISAEGRSSFWPWLKARYGFSDDQAHPYTFNLQPFMFNPQAAMQAFVSSETYAARKQNVPFNFYLLSDLGYPTYGNVLLASRSALQTRKDEIAAFLAASSEGWLQYIYGNGQDGDRAILAANAHMTPDQLAFSRATLKRIAAFGANGASILSMTDAHWMDIHKTLLQSGLITDDPRWRDGYTLSFNGALTARVPS